MSDTNEVGKKFSSSEDQASRSRINQFNKEIGAYRNYAVGKYKVKEKIFLQQLYIRDKEEFEGKNEQFQANLAKMIEADGIAKWVNVINELKNNSIVEIRKGSRGQLNAIYKMKTKENTFNIPQDAFEYIADHASNWRGKKGKVTKQGFFYESMLGFLYEDFIMKQSAKDDMAQIVDAGLLDIYKSLFQKLFHTGKVQGPQGLRTFGDILYDVMIDTQGQQFNKDFLNIADDNLLYGRDKDARLVTTGQTIELTYDDKAQNKILYDKKNEDLLERFKTSNLYGFGIKKYNITPGSGKANKFTSSAELQTTLNNKFKENNSATWNAIYAWAYVQTQVNRHIFDIVGPNSVGQFFGNMFLWTSDFIGSTLFTMRVQGQGGFEVSQDESQKFAEIHPNVPSSEIYFRYLNGKKIAFITASEKSSTDKDNPLFTKTKVNIKMDYLTE